MHLLRVNDDIELRTLVEADAEELGLCSPAPCALRERHLRRHCGLFPPQGRVVGLNVVQIDLAESRFGKFGFPKQAIVVSIPIFEGSQPFGLCAPHERIRLCG